MVEEIDCQLLTPYIKHLAVSALSSGTARFKSTCNLTGKCFENPTISYVCREAVIGAIVYIFTACCN
jgi:hypothetical protein